MDPTHRVHHSLTHRRITATGAGDMAVAALTDASRAAILGRTSRGIFVQLDTSRVIFLSREQHRSPLTVTLPKETPALDAIAPHDAIDIRERVVSFPDAGIQIHVPVGVIWACPDPTVPGLPASEQYRRLQRLVRIIVLTAPDRGWSRLLPAILNHDESHKIPHSLHTMWEAIQQLRSDLRAGAIETATRAATPLVGRGRGLTPSGDDFMLGLTLMLNRWYDRAPWNSSLKQYNTYVVEAARTHTTTLSAGLIESATRGASDERLVRTADYLATDMPSLASTVTDVLHWGSSSGIDALGGMALAVTSASESSL